jgi:DsbC/DsbD-like thiol-disulfide interchange protein
MFRSTLVACTFIGLSAGLVGAAPKSDTKVKATANAGKQDANGKQTIEVNLKINEGWHLYANPTETYPESRTVVTAYVGDKAIDVAVEYPKGKKVKDSTGPFSIYEGTVTIKVTVDRSKLGSKPIDLNIAVWACDATTCLFGGDIKLTVP